ncbi:hypothetical protein [Actinoallomurus iriomotensis]|uniref:Major facilitator superfamily (MFS) profile domain-containing protein n=1 Tax=Actinoallomurus iriomotensis TaxID=478107 RepID=A0A9W6RMH6_9ACTN|nr:hypothetical protein Airi01_068830 [Actinoallomurus iriomotensis]
MVTAGLALAAVGLLTLSTVHHATGYGTVWWRLAVVGVGFGLAMSPLTGAAVSSVNPQDSGLASGVSSTARQIGAILGVAVLGAVVRTRQSHGAPFGTGLDTAFLAAGVVTAAGAILTGLWLVRSRNGNSLANQAPEDHHGPGERPTRTLEPGERLPGHVGGSG